MIEFNATIFVQMVNFFIFLFIMKAVLFNPIIKSIRSRRDYIASMEKDINDKLQKFELAEKKYHDELNEARQKAQDVINKNMTLAEDEKQNIVKAASNEAKDAFESFKKELMAETAKTKAELSSEVDVLAKEIAEKIVASSADNNKALV